MTDKGLLKFGLLLGQQVISDTLIDEIARVGGVRYNPDAREILHELARHHVLDCLSRPPTKMEAKREAHSFKVLNKEALKRQTKRHQKIANLYAQGADLLKEDLEEGPLETGLAYKMWLKKRCLETPLKDQMCIPQLEALSRELAEIARDKQLRTESAARKTPVRQGRRPSLLDGLITGFGRLYIGSGGTLATTTDPIKNRPKVTPAFITALKMLIDALPADSPKPDRSAIAHRIRDRKLLRGLTVRRNDRQELKPSAIPTIICNRMAVKKLVARLPKGRN